MWMKLSGTIQEATLIFKVSYDFCKLVSKAQSDNETEFSHIPFRV